MMGWGMYLGSRRELVWTLRQRASRAESEQELRVAQGRSQERERIAREMHDVLAHRITQISMQAGALAFRDDLAADQLRDGLGEIQGKSNEAIHELRGVLGVLRDETTGELVEGPQPTYADIAALVAESRGNGVHVEFSDRVDRSTAAVPDVVGRALYRIIQEGLTNATKHAPGALVSVALSGSPERGIDVLIRNPLGFAVGSPPGAGLGLVGPGRARRAARRHPGPRPGGPDVRAARLDTVDGMSERASEPSGTAQQGLVRARSEASTCMSIATRSIKVLVVDDDPLVRSALALMLGRPAGPGPGRRGRRRRRGTGDGQRRATRTWC